MHVKNTTTRSLVSAAVILGAVWLTGMLTGHRSRADGTTDQHRDGGNDGAAVVINLAVPSDVEVPSAEQVREDPKGTIAALRGAGLRVATDPSGHCIASVGVQLPPDEDVCEDGCAVAALVVTLCATISAEQFASREMGYLRWGQMSERQQAVALQLGRMCGLLAHDRGAPTEGAQLAIGVGPRWVAHVAARGEEGYAECVRLFIESEPPTQAAVAAPPLPGSALWWASPYFDAAWGDETVDLKPGIRSLDELTSELCAAGDIDIVVAPSAREMPLAVTASSISLRRLIWAIEVATGLPARLAAGAEPPIVRIGFGKRREDWYHQDYNLLLPIPEVGYWSPSGTPIGQVALPLLQGGPAQHHKQWIGWRFSDLPLLYQNSIRTEWERAHRAARGHDAPAFDAQRTFVLWTQAIKVSIALLDADGGGQGYEFAFPVLYE